MCIPRASLAAIVLSVASLAVFAQAPSPEEGWPAGERILGKYRAGHYAEVIAEAPATLRTEPWNNELRLAYANSLLWTGREWDAIGEFRPLLETDLGVDARLGTANGLAWSGRMSEAIPHYQRLVDGPKSDEAKLGMANALRWMGRDDLALPLYQQLRAAHPGKDIGEEGLFFARRAVRARTTLGFGYARDNTPMRRREPTLSHTWRAANNSLVFGLDASGGDDRDDAAKLDRREFGFRVESLETPLAPRLTLSRQTEPEGRTFGELRLQAAQWPLYVHAGRVNWGKLAFTVPALDQGLTAKRFGIEGQYQVGLGELRGYANHFSISDDNRIDNGDLRLAFRYRPWAREVKPFVGVHFRRSDHADPDYWSPKKYVLGYVGLEGEWITREWSITALGQVGFKIAGEAATAWAASITAKRWVGEDWAVGLNAYAQSGTRESKYRAEGVALLVEKLW